MLERFSQEDAVLKRKLNVRAWFSLIKSNARPRGGATNDTNRLLNFHFCVTMILLTSLDHGFDFIETRD